MKKATFILAALLMLQAIPSEASPSDLPYGHWFTCGAAGQKAVRRDPPFFRRTPEDQVAKYIPQFNGSYGFEVQDTWEEMVTKSGNDCFHCGSTKSKDSSGNVTESCNYCSWQELETFYRHWSNQTTTWHAEWNQDQNYRKMRRKWIADGSPDVAVDLKDVQNLQKFDPDRPLEYFLFPGEVETVHAINDSGRNIAPYLTIEDSRHEYKIDTTVNGGDPRMACADKDLHMESKIYTGKRLVTTTPNSLEFREGWISSEQDPTTKAVKSEPTLFKVVDLSALRYEKQNVMDHYKDTSVQIKLREVNRSWWFDRFITAPITQSDLHADLKETKSDDDQPDVAEFNFDGVALLRTPWFKHEFHLHPKASYELCGRVLRANNIYYKTKTWIGGTAWSEWNCAQFTYMGDDLRKTNRKIADFVSQILFISW